MDLSFNNLGSGTALVFGELATLLAEVSRAPQATPSPTCSPSMAPHHILPGTFNPALPPNACSVTYLAPVVGLECGMHL